MNIIFFSALLFPAIIISPLLMVSEFIINHLYAKIVINPVKGQLISEKPSKRIDKFLSKNLKRGQMIK